jgi:[ribosomal protein S18]-alanine N-acetyltransferase
VILRAATDHDVAAVHALEQEAFGGGAWSERSVREELTGERRRAVVACDPSGGGPGGASGRPPVVGFAVTVSAGDAVDLQRIVVRPSHRRSGLAHRLLAAVSPKEGRLLLEVSERNTGARAFYAAEGFAEIARRPHYYRDGSDAVVMERTR